MKQHNRTNTNGDARNLKHIGMLFALGVLAGTGAVISTAAAQAVLEEITVTARKVEESLQSAPVSVTAFTGEDLISRGVTDLEEMGNFAPNMEFFASGISGSNSGQVYIRGIGQFDYFPTVDPGVGIYVDGVYMARTVGAILDLVDVERVEILRGPQGTLYGKNTVGGAINFVFLMPCISDSAPSRWISCGFVRGGIRAFSSISFAALSLTREKEFFKKPLVVVASVSCSILMSSPKDIPSGCGRISSAFAGSFSDARAKTYCSAFGFA